ncbi:MAG: ERF family protein [Methylovulum sp.]
MNVYGKLQKARVMLQSVKMTKSGNNKFAGYSYFELGDFMPHINQIFHEVGLCGVVAFGHELAELLIHETDGDGTISITSPMADAQLKGCHAIQQLGAVETYQRRYLWMAAMEIVEHDAIDSAPKITEAEKQAALQDEVNKWCSKLAAAEDADTLRVTWKAIPKHLHPACLDAKDDRKAQFEVSV